MQMVLHQLFRKKLAAGRCFAIIVLLISMVYSPVAKSQQTRGATAGAGFITTSFENTGTQQVFIENIGQYGNYMEGYLPMGAIKFGYEGLGMPVLFTPKGLIHLQRNVEKLSHKEEENLEKAGAKEEEIEHQRKTTDRIITMEWVGANENAAIITEDKSFDYHTYGLLTEKAYGYKKIIYKNLYPGIDIVYNFTNTTAAGFEYSIVAEPGADLNVVKIKYGGDVKSIKTDNKGNLCIRSDIDGVSATIPQSYYGKRSAGSNQANIKTYYKIFNNEISFVFPQGYDSTKAITLDPFVSSTGNLTGTFAGKAIDVDYDYAGNVYVAGGGSTNQTGTASHSYAKYNSAGTLLWTFNGILSIPVWQAGYYYGGWVADKSSGALYIGQGFAFQGFRVIRVSTTGLYDNYISTANASFQEDWKMYWYCNSGNPQILCAGGGTTGNNNIAICTPPSATLLASANLTGAAAAYQDMSDLVIDPVTNSLYSVYASGLDKTIENRIFKHNAPYSAATTVWSTLSGYTVLGEILNRPYLGGSYADNSSNILAVNASYLFYWDGLNLKAIDKATGATVGTPLTVAGNLKLNQGGIVADACNNVFIGNTNGTIKVYQFNGTVFDDAAANDIAIPGFSTNVYDLALDESKKLLYASGDGFVASFDVAAYCPATIFTVNVVPNCLTASAAATISPAPPAGSTITYTLFNGAAQIGAATTTGLFTGLNPNIIYTVVATVNLACSGAQASTHFILPGPTINFTQTNSTCGAYIGTITALGSGTPGPYLYSLNGGPFQPGGNFTGLAGGIYTLVVQGAGGCPNDTVINILNSNGPALSFTQTNAICGNNTGTVTATATGGTTPYQYSINSGTTYQSGNFFTGLTAGDYVLVVKDAGGCTNRVIVTVISSPAVTLSAIPGSATCGQNNGTITEFGNGGTVPLQYSINGNIFQTSNVFTGVTAGIYTVTVKDAVGCTTSVIVTVDNVPPPAVAAIANGAACGNINGSITASGSNGILPYQYSINGGVTFQTGNVFTGLAPGAYTITIKDATGCTSSVAITVANANSPAVSAVATTSSCAASTGTITASVSGGAPPYQYSINGNTFFASNVFTALPPGNYVVFVKDNAGCIATVRVAVTALSGPAITAVVAPASCIASNGSITATGTGGTAPLQYSIDGIVYGAGNVFTGLASSLYTVYVKDANGCIKTISVTVGNASGLAVSVSAITSSCSIANGLITATTTGGIAPLQYSIDGISYQASNVFNGLSAATYTVYVKDANGCIITKQATISAVAGPSFSLSVQQNATCGTASGVIRVSATGGVAPLSYNIDGGAFQPAPIFVSVAPGLHSIIVKDATGCTTVAQSITVTNSASGTAITDVTFTVRDILACTGEGRIKNLKGFPTGGGNNYEFSLDGGPFTTANQFRPVSAGYHTITARNRTSLCSITKLVTIGIGIPATATASSTGSACGASTGTITLTGVGANTPYHSSIDNGITWQTFASTFTFSGLAPAIYPIIIADDADFTTGPPDLPGACLTTIFVAVPSIGGPAISTTQVNPSCTANTGSITVTGSSGTGPYTYSADGGPYTASGVFSGLDPGPHAISVKDATGCINGLTVILANASVPTVTAQVLPTSCNLNNGTIAATGTGGVAPLEYSINGTVYVTNNIFTGLAPGSYTLYVRDANRCFSTLPVTIVNTPLPEVTAYTIAAICNNNDGTVVAEGSFGQSPYTFSINGTAFQSSGTFNELTAGFYTVYLKDAAGCISTTGVTVSNIGGPAFTAAVIAAKCGNTNGSITVTASGGTPGYEYSSDGGITFQAGNILNPLAPGTYAVVVRDANGCKASGAITIADILGPQTLTAVVTDASCGNANGSITATVTGGTAPLQYSKDGTTYQGSNILTGAAAGSYTLYVKDANGCIKTLPVTVLNLQGPLVSAASSSSSCGSSDGTITVLATGGTIALSYSKDGGASFQSGNIFTGLAPGTYTILIKDAKGCNSQPVPVIVSTFSGSSTLPTFNPVAAICAGSIIAPLPTTSLNGITGTWSPALNNTATTTYTFTPAAGQCATIATLTIAVTPAVTPTFNPVTTVCTGSIIAPLPTTSLEGITGTWSPALNNTATTTYTFTPAAGQCAATATLTITVNPAITPTFNPVASICAGSTIAPLPTTSLNGITGTWSPVLNNTTTTTYTFTPAAGQCATTVTLTLTVAPILAPAINCGVSTTSEVTFTWPAVTGATGYNVSYQVGSGTIVNVGPVGNVTTYQVNGLSAGDVVAITVSPTVSAAACFTAATGICTATACTPPTASISYSSSFCVGGTTDGQVTLSGTGAYTGGQFSALTGLVINSNTGAITPAGSLPGTYTITYSVTGTGGCPGTTATATVVINPLVIPVFSSIPPVCQGSVITALPTISNNGLTGTWSPALSNTTTTTYTFTPAAGQCAEPETLTITVIPGVTPLFDAIAPVCAGTLLAPLPSSSLNGIAGSWSPALNNLATTTYTFTPVSGQCAVTATLTIIILPAVAPAFDPVAPVCSYSPLTPLPTISLNGITGNWFPALNNTTTTTYTFTPAAGQCAVATTLIIAINPEPASPAVIIAQPNCLLPDAFVTVSSATAGLTFSIDGATFSAYPAGGYSGLPPGTHTLYAKNSSGCLSAVTNFTVNTAPPAPAAVSTVVTDASCGTANGSLTIGAITGGTAPFNYSLDGSAFTSTLVYVNLFAGSHTLTVKDNNGCSFATGVAINNTGGATVTAVSTAATCGASNGTITATGSNGTAPYQYAADGASFQQANSFTGLTAGLHIVSIKDANNCINTFNITISAISGATATVVVTDAACGAANGSITANGTGGTAPYQYSIDGINFQSGNVFTGLAGGIYSITIKDANGCTSTNTASITNSNGADITAVATNAACGAANGAVTANGTGGTPPYQYSTDGINFQTSNVFSGLTAGNYTITIKDNNSCKNTARVSIANSNGASVTAAITNTACGARNGIITAAGTGGTTPYQYSIDGVNFQTGNVFAGLLPANYILTIKDANECTNTLAVTIANVAAPGVAAVSTAAGCGAADGTITAMGSGGTGPYQYSLDAVNFQSSNIFAGLSAGTYTVTVKDTNSCTGTKAITIGAANTITISAGGDITICQGSSARLNAVTNAASFSWSPAAGLSNANILNPVAAPVVTTAYIITATTGQCSQSDTVVVQVTTPPTAFAGNDVSICMGQRLQLHAGGGSNFQWSPPDFLSVANTQNPVFFALHPGRFTLLLGVTDSNGCHSVKNDTVVITVFPPVAVFAGNDTTVAINQALQLHALDVNGSGFTSYNWSPATGLNNVFSKDPIFSLPGSNTYTYHVTATTAEGCAATDDIVIKVFIRPDLYVPNAFTPNGDGRNDVLKVIPVGIKELKYFTVYNRWGETVFTTQNLSAGWDGLYKGQKQDSNTFVWVAEAVDFSGNVLTRKGVAILIR